MDMLIPNTNAPRRRAFTLIELVAVMVVLAVLSAVAIPKYFDYADRAKEAADEASIAGIGTAMGDVHLQHRINDAPSAEWITNVSMIASLMETGTLPSGIRLNPNNANFIEDSRGYDYFIIAETETAPARLVKLGGDGGWS